MDWIMDWILDSIGQYLVFCCLKQNMNARVSNEWRNGLIVGTGIHAAFGKDWVVAIAQLLQSPSPDGWQGVVLHKLISFKD